MTVENRLKEMMSALGEPGVAGEGEWKRFATKAHRSLYGRRAVIVGVSGIAAFTGTSLTVGPPGGSPNLGPAGTGAGVGEEKPTGEVEVWFVKDGKLQRTIQESSAGVIESEDTGGSVDHLAQLEDAIERVLAGPPGEEDLGSAIPEGTRIVDFEIRTLDGITAVLLELSEEFDTALSPSLAEAQVVYTATQRPEIGAVFLTTPERSESEGELKDRSDFEEYEKG